MIKKINNLFDYSTGSILLWVILVALFLLDDNAWGVFIICSAIFQLCAVVEKSSSNVIFRDQVTINHTHNKKGDGNDAV